MNRGASRTRDAAVMSHRAEAAFQRWGYFVISHRWPALVLPLLLAAYLASWLPQLTIDNSRDRVLRPDDLTAVRYREFRDRFDRDDRIIIAIEPPDVFDVSFLEVLRRLHLALEAELPYVEKITSIFNARSVRGEREELIVEDLIEGWRKKWPTDGSSTEGLRERVMSNPLFINTIVSGDAHLTTVTIKPFTYSTLGRNDVMAGFDDEATGEDKPPFLTAAENDELLASIRRVLEHFENPDFPIYLGGSLVVTDRINRAVAADSRIFIGASIAVIITLLFVLFRRVTGAVLPLLVVLLAVVSSLGIMIILGIPGTPSVQILPVFLLAVGICDAIHILTITYQRLTAGEAKRDAIAYALGHSGLAVVMTSLTTAAGMMSFVTAEVTPVSQLGIIAPIGVMLALGYTLVLLPALLALVPLRPPSRRRGGGRVGGGVTGVIVRLGTFASDHPGFVLAAAATIVGVSLVGAFRTRFAHLELDWFDPDDPMRVATEVIDRDLRGSMSLEIIIDTGRENGLHDPDVLKRIEAATRYAEGMSHGEVFVGKAISIVDIVKETNKALHGNDPAYYVLPDDRKTIAQELLLFENSDPDDLRELVDAQLRTARLSLRAPLVDAMLYVGFIPEIEAGLRNILGQKLEIATTGFMPVLVSIVSAEIVSMARSYVFAFLVITPMMMVLLHSFKLGLVSMIPNLIPVIFTLGLMGWFAIPLDASTIMIGAMVISLAVDDTIHFMHKFRLYYAELRDPRLAIRATLQSTGAALLFTSLVLAGGFFIFCLATMINTRNFGLLAAIATLVAFAADVLVGPALMTLAAQKGRLGLESALSSGPAGVSVSGP